MWGGEEREEKKRIENSQAELKTQETLKWPKEVTHVRKKKDPLISGPTGLAKGRELE